jgi:hypothetical protein
MDKRYSDVQGQGYWRRGGEWVSRGVEAKERERETAIKEYTRERAMWRVGRSGEKSGLERAKQGSE